MRRVDWNQMQRKKKMEQLVAEKALKRNAARRSLITPPEIHEPMRRVDFERIQKTTQRARSRTIPTSKVKKSGYRRDGSAIKSPGDINVRHEQLGRHASTCQATPRTAPSGPNWNPWFGGNEELESGGFSGSGGSLDTVRSSGFLNPFDLSHFEPLDLNAGQSGYNIPDSGLDFLDADAFGTPDQFRDAGFEGHLEGELEPAISLANDVDDFALPEHVISEMLRHFIDGDEDHDGSLHTEELTNVIPSHEAGETAIGSATSESRVRPWEL